MARLSLPSLFVVSIAVLFCECDGMQPPPFHFGQPMPHQMQPIPMNFHHNMQKMMSMGLSPPKNTVSKSSTIVKESFNIQKPVLKEVKTVKLASTRKPITIGNTVVPKLKYYKKLASYQKGKSINKLKQYKRSASNLYKSYYFRKS